MGQNYSSAVVVVSIKKGSRINRPKLVWLRRIDSVHSTHRWIVMTVWKVSKLDESDLAACSDINIAAFGDSNSTF